MKKTISLVLVLALGLAAVFAFPSTAYSQTAEWTVYDTTNSGLPYNGVTGFSIDAQGTVWIGTGRWGGYEGGGLARFDGKTWRVYSTANSPLPNNDHTGLAIDEQGNLWIGTEGGTLTKFDGESWTLYGRPTSAPQLASPSFDALGNLWIGSWGGGLVKFDGVDDWTVYNTGNSGLPNNRAWATVFDGQGNLWIGTYGSGVAKFDGADNWTVYNTANSGLPHNEAAIGSGSLSVDGQGNVWIGTWGGGLAKFDAENWTVYNTSNSGLPDNSIYSLAIGARGNVWIGTWSGGLAKFDGENWTVYNTSNSGLPDNRIYSLAIDAHGVWIGTESGGLAVYRPRPAVDFNSDGIVDSADMCIMVNHWGTDEPAYDIGPMPWGDGIVDVQDLIVLSEHLFTYPGAIAYWKLDETEGDVAYDSVGVYDGVLNGVPTWQPTGGVVDGALELDGIDDYVSAPFVFNPVDGAFSVLAWIKGGGPGQVIISQADGANWLSADSAGGNLMTELAAPGRSGKPMLSQTNITDGNWYRIGFIWDGSRRILYVDGIAVAEDTEARLKGSDNGLYIGTGKAMEAGTYWSGLIDDVRIYNRAVRP
ncbi:MAG: two-component regulator propeller domain-containing protein [Planctomycetota bacterium]|jgi:sugar lactone lactonase YvrE